MAGIHGELTAWLSSVEADDVLPRHVVADSFARAGIRTVPLDGAAHALPGILVFDRVTRSLCDLARRVSRSGLERVLALAATRAALGGDGAWRLLDAGVSDVLAWDAAAEPGGVVAARLERWRRVDDLIRSPLVQRTLVGQSAGWIAMLRQVIEVARFTDASVLVTGETGTGKELVARLIHALDARPGKRDFVVLDCSTIVAELSGSEFFGHERGAFTGALTARDGAFALADGGTLFLDEVGDLPLALQAQLLRVVQERAYKRVGGNVWKHTEFRLVCATNRTLQDAVAQGTFRHDLYHRIAAWICRLPPLRQHPEDILPLARHFLQEHDPDASPPELDPLVAEYLLGRDYPGNVRELKQLLARIRCRHVGVGPITVGYVSADERPSRGPEPATWDDESLERTIRRALALGAGLKEIRRLIEDVAVRIAVNDEGGNLQRAARTLHVTDRALQLRQAARRRHRSVGDGAPWA